MRTANPALGDTTFSSLPRQYSSTENMSIGGTVYKTGLLLLIVLLTAGWTWNLFYKTGNISAVTPWMMVGMFGGLILAFATIFKKTWSPITSPLYAACEGLLIGGISASLEASFPNIVIQAVGLTFGTLAAMLFFYQTGIIRATEKFKLGIFAATGGIAVVYLISMVLSFFGISVPVIYGNGWGGIAFSLFVVVIAALNFIIDFDFIEQGARQGAPKYMEWYGAFALMVTLIWLYIEILRLLTKLRESK